MKGTLHHNTKAESGTKEMAVYGLWFSTYSILKEIIYKVYTQKCF